MAAVDANCRSDYKFFFPHSSAEKTMLKKYKSHRAVPDFIFENIDELIK